MILLATLAIALGASTYGFNVIFARTTSRSANGLLRTRASSELALLSLKNGRITEAKTEDDGLADNEAWIFQHGKPVDRPRERTPLDAAAAKLALTPGARVDVPASDVRLYSIPVVIDGVREGMLVTGISYAPYEQAEHRAVLGSLVLALIMLALAGSATWWALKAALRPVVKMTEQAAAWSALDLDRRFDRGEPGDELSLLAQTLDAMLDRIAASLRHERRFAAELSHELRTPLARVIAEVELALRRDREAGEYRASLQLVLKNAQQLARIVETLVAAARHEAGGARGTTDAYDVATEAIGGVTHLAAERSLTVNAERPAVAMRLGLDSDLAERVLHPVLENACRYGSSWARVRIVRSGAKVAYVVEDDGPGVAEQELETIFEPGRRGLAANGLAANGPSADRISAEGPSADGVERYGVEGAGLGLALARRLARSASGDVVARAAPEGGCFVVTLPAA